MRLCRDNRLCNVVLFAVHKFGTVVGVDSYAASPNTSCKCKFCASSFPRSDSMLFKLVECSTDIDACHS